jgi:DNA helicase-2/ATP-dependent DNA helicase PcrA
MINRTEQEERAYLEEIKERLELALNRIDNRVREFSEELRQTW